MICPRSVFLKMFTFYLFPYKKLRKMVDNKIIKLFIT